MADWYCHVRGEQYGPVDEETLRNWVGQGRVTPSTKVWRTGMNDWVEARAIPGLFQDATGSAPPPPPSSGQRTTARRSGGFSSLGKKPHRGVAVLVLAIMAWVVGCFVLSIVALIMASNDLEEIQAGTMDPEGESMTQAGRIVAIIHLVISAIGLLVFLLFLVAAGPASM
jgi:hypothetical protein